MFGAPNPAVSGARLPHARGPRTLAVSAFRTARSRAMTAVDVAAQQARIDQLALQDVVALADLPRQVSLEVLSPRRDEESRSGCVIRQGG